MSTINNSSNIVSYEGLNDSFTDDVEEEEEIEETQVLNDGNPLLESHNNFGSGNIVYFCFLLLGLGTLLPWNFFITADSYWQYKFRNVSEANWRPRETTLQTIYDPFMVCLSQLTNFVFLFVNALFSYLICERRRLLWSLFVVLLCFGVTAALSRTPTDDWQTEFFVLTMIIIFIMNAFTAIFQGGLFGLSSRFPQRFTNAVGVGQAVGGIFAALARILSVYTGVGAVQSAFIYFCSAAAVMALTLIEYIYVSRTTFFRHYSHTTIDKKGPDFDVSGAEVPVVTEGALKSHFRLLRRVWPLALAVCFDFMVTLAVFPVLCVKITSAASDIVWKEKYFQPVATFLLFNVCDYAGRTVSEFTLWPRRDSTRLLQAMSFTRVVFVPLLLLCHHEHPSSFPSVFDHDGWYVAIMAAFGFSNGYVFSLCMMYAPRMVCERDREKVGSLMTVWLGLGLLIGSVASFAFTLVS